MPGGAPIGAPPPPGGGGAPPGGAPPPGGPAPPGRAAAMDLRSEGIRSLDDAASLPKSLVSVESALLTAEPSSVCEPSVTNACSSIFMPAMAWSFPFWTFPAGACGVIIGAPPGAPLSEAAPGISGGGAGGGGPAPAPPPPADSAFMTSGGIDMQFPNGNLTSPKGALYP
jgi:hypothetical protein